MSNIKKPRKEVYMKTKFKKMDISIHLPRKVKDDTKKSIEKRLSEGVLHSLHKTVIGKHAGHDRDYAIYGEDTVNYHNIFPITNARTNYIAGSVTSDIFYLVEIGELVWIGDHFEMMDFEENQKITINLKTTL